MAGFAFPLFLRLPRHIQRGKKKLSICGRFMSLNFPFLRLPNMKSGKLFLLMFLLLFLYGRKTYFCEEAKRKVDYGFESIRIDWKYSSVERKVSIN